MGRYGASSMSLSSSPMAWNGHSLFPMGQWTPKRTARSLPSDAPAALGGGQVLLQLLQVATTFLGIQVTQAPRMVLFWMFPSKGKHPHSWMMTLVENPHLEMDDDWGYHHLWTPLFCDMINPTHGIFGTPWDYPKRNLDKPEKTWR